MCLAYGDGKTVPDDEIVAIQEELDKQLPGVQVMFIPTVLYERIFSKVFSGESMIGSLPNRKYMGEVDEQLYHESTGLKNFAQKLHHVFNEKLLTELAPNSQRTKKSLSRAIYTANHRLPALDKRVADLETRALRKGQFLR